MSFSLNDDNEIVFSPESVSSVPAVGSDLFEDEIQVFPFEGVQDLSLDDVSVVDGCLCYRATVSNYGACTLVFSPIYEDYLSLVDGVLFNHSSSNVTGRLFVGDSFSLDDGDGSDVLLVTVLGRSSSGYASNLYRYGSSYYVTSYSPGMSSSLSSSNSYVSVSDVEVVGFSNFQVLYWVSLFAFIFIIVSLSCMLVGRVRN